MNLKRLPFVLIIVAILCSYAFMFVQFYAETHPAPRYVGPHQLATEVATANVPGANTLTAKILWTADTDEGWDVEIKIANETSKYLAVSPRIDDVAFGVFASGKRIDVFDPAIQDKRSITTVGDLLKIPPHDHTSFTTLLAKKWLPPDKIDALSVKLIAFAHWPKDTKAFAHTFAVTSLETPRIKFDPAP